MTTKKRRAPRRGRQVGDRAETPRPIEVRCFNAMALWQRVLARPLVLAPLIRTPVVP
jgi:hypothetical protein